MWKTAKSSRRSNRHVLRRGVYSLVTLLVVGIAQAQAGVFVLNIFGLGISSAGGLISTPTGPAPYWMSDGHTDGLRVGPTAASMSLTHPVTGLHVDASGRTSGLFNLEAHVHMFGVVLRPFSIGLADQFDPFENPIQPVPDKPAEADLVCEGEVYGNVLVLNGKGNTNENGYLELSVLDLSTLDPKEFEQILREAGSVEKALAQGKFAKEQVLARYREAELAGAFEMKVDLGNVPPDRVAVCGVAHGFMLQSSGN
jgi:hypothetical protein